MWKNIVYTCSAIIIPIAIFGFLIINYFNKVPESTNICILKEGRSKSLTFHNYKIVCIDGVQYIQNYSGLTPYINKEAVDEYYYNGYRKCECK